MNSVIYLDSLILGWNILIYSVLSEAARLARAGGVWQKKTRSADNWLKLYWWSPITGFLVPIWKSLRGMITFPQRITEHIKSFLRFSILVWICVWGEGLRSNTTGTSLGCFVTTIWNLHKVTLQSYEQQVQKYWSMLLWLFRCGDQVQTTRNWLCGCGVKWLVW